MDVQEMEGSGCGFVHGEPRIPPASLVSAFAGDGGAEEPQAGFNSTELIETVPACRIVDAVLASPSLRLPSNQFRFHPIHPAHSSSTSPSRSALHLLLRPFFNAPPSEKNHFETGRSSWSEIRCRVDDIERA